MQMEFDPRVIPAPEGLAMLGTVVELRELPYGLMRQAIAKGYKVQATNEGLLAESLHIDGKPLGLERLMALPGRLAGPIGKALEAVIKLHDLKDDETAPDDPAAADAGANLGNVA